ncbi:uncharacterized protein [Miscanthus floridulus]|uniref:uncharacterized protein n=1 Tax=Miscanthus floridulus TaxID=154761 RepID=UPI003459813D
MSMLEAILAAVSAEYREPLGTKSSAKEAWEAIAAMHVDSGRAKKAMAQLLKQEYANLKVKDGEAVDDFSLRLQTLISKLRSHGVIIDEEEAEKKAEAHLAQADNDDEAILLMEMFCALYDIEAKEKGEVMAVEGPGKVLKVVNLDEPRAQVHLRHVGGEQEQQWYLNSGASNHMTGSKAAFSELDDNVTGTVKFGEGLRVVIQGRGAIIFSIGQRDEYDSEVLMKDNVLRIRDREQRLLVKVKSFDTLGRLEKMVTRLPHIEHVGELYDSCLAKKKRRLSFPKTVKYYATETLELVHGDLCGLITPVMPGGRKYFILLVDDCSR